MYPERYVKILDPSIRQLLRKGDLLHMRLRRKLFFTCWDMEEIKSCYLPQAQEYLSQNRKNRGFYMKITAIYFQGVPPHPLPKVLHIVTYITRLEVTVDLIDLALGNCPTMKENVDEMDQIIKDKESQGVLLGSCISQGSLGDGWKYF